MANPRQLIVLAGALGMIILSACGTTTPSRFYTLQTDESISVSGSMTGNAAITVGPFRFAEYLARSQIVSRPGGAQLDIAEFDRWASPLPALFQQTVAANLAIALRSERILEYPTTMPLTESYQITGRVNRFDTDNSGRAVLEVEWGIRDSAGTMHRPAARARYSSDASGTSFAARVNAQSDAAADFSRDIANAFLSLQESAATRPSP